MYFVGGGIDDLGSEDRRFRNIAPFFGFEMLGVDADYLPLGAYLDLVGQIYALTSRFRQ
jgi:hypothetical protein